GPNNPMTAACWFAIVKAGAIAVATMPLLRAKELTDIIVKAQISHALCDARLIDELQSARAHGPTLGSIVQFGTMQSDGIEARADSKPADFENVETASDDIALIACASGISGKRKITMVF